MRVATRSCWLTLGLFSAVLSSAWAQESPPAAQPATPAREVSRPDQLEPGVDTSATPAPASSAQASQQKADSATRADAPFKQSPAASAATAPKPGAPAAAHAGKAQDRLELDPTQITGNRELPKVLYIVPWKRSDLGDLVGKPVNSLLDEVLQPVDRDVFKRENRYYDALKPDEAPQTAAGAHAAGEKR